MSEKPTETPPVSASVPASPTKESAPTLEQIIKENAPDILKAIPGNMRRGLGVRIEQHSSIQMRSSPLPDPSELAAYSQIIPNGADRIMKMAEEQAAHRISIEKIVVTSQQNQASFGQVCGLIIGLSGLAMATYAAVSGQPAFGGVIGGTTLVSLVSVFLVSRHSQKRELGQKQQQITRPPSPPSQKNRRKN
jgi:uncharacterized membrane protein